MLLLFILLFININFTIINIHKNHNNNNYNSYNKSINNDIMIIKLM